MCAKIFLKGKLQGIDINDELAKKINEDWLLGSLPDVVSLDDSNSFKRSELKSIEGIYTEKQEKKYDLDNPNDRKIIKDFEKEFLFWLETNPKYKSSPFSDHKWYESLDIIRVTSEDFTQFNIYRDRTKEFKEIKKKWSALQSLRIRREEAKKHNTPPVEEIAVESLPF